MNRVTQDAGSGDSEDAAETGVGANPGADDAGDGSDPGSVPGLPCEVSDLLAAYCVSCHGSHPSGGAPMPLVTYEDLTAPAMSDASRTVAERSLTLMNGGFKRMPPAGDRPSDGAIAAFSAWVDDGAPRRDCATIDADAGTVADPFATPVVCTSGNYWRGREGATMRPGEACISCHAREGEAPRFAIAGTVYPTGHEPNACNGSSAQPTIEITDADGNVHELMANSVGNFAWEGTLASPYTAKITYQGRTRAMGTPQTSGDCNTCHTESGESGAPGRILLP